MTTWQTCKTHGDATENAWGCPECVREMRQEIGHFRHSLAQSGKLAEDRLLQMKADRAEALRWRDKLDSALTVCRSAVRVIESSAYQGVSDEDLENSVRNWQQTERAHKQREQLAAQLAGRTRAPVNVADYGAPALDET